MHDLKHPGTPSENESLRQLTVLVSGRLSPGDVPAVQWRALTDLALNHGLGPMLLGSIKDSGIRSVPSEDCQTLMASAHQTAVADILFEDSLRSITRTFDSAQIPCIWLKGAVLARTVYPQSSLRPMGDLDVLVPHVQSEAALEVLRSLGYEFDVHTTFRPGYPDKIDETYLKHLAFHHYALIGGGARAVKVELHFGLMAHTGDRLLPDEHIAWFWEHTQPFYLADQTSCVGLSPEAHLLYLAAHNIFQHGEAEAFLMRDLDVHLLITQEHPDWNMIIDQAVVLGWTFAVARALERAVNLFDTSVPKIVFEQLSVRRPAHEDPSYLLQKQAPGYRWECVQETLSRLPVRDKIRYYIQSLFPVADYMRSRYAVSPDRPIWPYYPYRWFDQCRDILAAMGKRLLLAKGGKP
jgi:hypothetical protein